MRLLVSFTLHSFVALRFISFVSSALLSCAARTQGGAVMGPAPQTSLGPTTPGVCVCVRVCTFVCVCKCGCGCACVVVCGCVDVCPNTATAAAAAAAALLGCAHPLKYYDHPGSHSCDKQLIAEQHIIRRPGSHSSMMIVCVCVCACVCAQVMPQQRLQRRQQQLLPRCRGGLLLMKRRRSRQFHRCVCG